MNVDKNRVFRNISKLIHIIHPVFFHFFFYINLLLDRQKDADVSDK